EASATADLAVSLSAASTLPITVNYAATGGTATGGGIDYTLTSGTLTFNPGDTSKSIAIAITNDALNEGDETIQVTLSGPANSTLGAISVPTFTILDDDSAPSVAFASSSSSGSESVSAANLAVILSTPSSLPITVNYTTGGTATGGGIDYTLTSGTLTFNPGDTSKTIAIAITNDAL